MASKYITFSFYEKLNNKEKKELLKEIYDGCLIDMVIDEHLNWTSYEKMDLLDKAYWNQDIYKQII